MSAPTPARVLAQILAVAGDHPNLVVAAGRYVRPLRHTYTGRVGVHASNPVRPDEPCQVCALGLLAFEEILDLINGDPLLPYIPAALVAEKIGISEGEASAIDAGFECEAEEPGCPNPYDREAAPREYEFFEVGRTAYAVLVFVGKDVS